jgi:hypothetical protein
MPPEVHALRSLDLPYAVCGVTNSTQAALHLEFVTCPRCRRRLERRQRTPYSHQLEASWQSDVIAAARTAGFLAYHTHDPRRSPEGFPDLILAHELPGRPLYGIELKTEDGQTTDAQEAWLAAIGGSVGIVTAVWRPSMLEEIIAHLRRSPTC